MYVCMCELLNVIVNVHAPAGGENTVECYIRIKKPFHSPLQRSCSVGTPRSIQCGHELTFCYETHCNQKSHYWKCCCWKCCCGNVIIGVP